MSSHLRSGSDDGGSVSSRLALDPEHLREALSLESNKPDSRNPFALSEVGSPVSPLRPRAAPAASSSSSSSAGSVPGRRTSHSGELKPVPADSACSPASSGLRPGHRRSGSGPLIYTSNTATSPATNVLPAGNICPTGRIATTGMVTRTSPRSDVLGSGTVNYGHGSIMSSGVSPSKPDAVVGNLQQAIRMGNELYRKGQYSEALRWYDKAVDASPESAGCRSNRAAALIGLGRIGEAARECEEAVRIDPANGRAHHRLAGIYLRLGMVESARRHFGFSGHGMFDPVDCPKLQTVERHFRGCTDARKIGDWKSALQEADSAIAAGADHSILVLALRAEALLRLHKIDEADSTLSNSHKLWNSTPLLRSTTNLFGMSSDSYFHIIRAQVDMALGRFDDAVAAAEKARQIDPSSMEVSMVLNNVRLVTKARAHGNELFKAGSFAEASIAYGEGLKYDPLNTVLYCNRAACWSKLGQWEKAIEDCNEALRIQPSYTKALLRRAASSAKIERWADCVRDYEMVRKELPGNKEVAEGLFHAQVALKMTLGEEVSNMKFGGEVEEIADSNQFQAAITSPGVSVVYFMAAGNQQCAKFTPHVDALCTRYPSVNFLKIDISKSTTIVGTENIRIVPCFKIYKNGARVKEMICPNLQILEYSVRHYSL